MKNIDEKIIAAEKELKNLLKKKEEAANEKSKHITKHVINFMREIYHEGNDNHKELSILLKKSLLNHYKEKPRIFNRLNDYFSKK